MSRPTPRRARPPSIPLPAAKVAAWRLARQRLAGPAAESPEAVARDLVGVQAQVQSSAALAIALRTRGTTDAAIDAIRARRLVRAWAMRWTLHLLAPEDLPTIVAVNRQDEPWRRPAWLRWFEMTEAQVEAAIEAVGEILDDGRPRTRAQLAEELEPRFGPWLARVVRGSWGGFLKLAGNRGYVCQAWTDDASVAFVRPSRWLGGWRVEDPEAALRALVLRYLAAYGPASKAEIKRWWGMTGNRIDDALRDLGRGLTEVEVDGARGYARTADLEAIEAAEPLLDSVHLLGGFDPLIVAAGLRSQLIPEAHRTRVSRTAGWISPVVLLDGAAGGVWDARRAGGRLAITVEPFEAPGPRRKARIAIAAKGVAAAQGATATTRYGRVFQTTKAAPEGIPTPEYPLRRCRTRSST